MVATILGVMASYLVGAVPFGYMAGKVLRGIDVRSYGSGNVGATNVLRTIGAGPGIMVLLLDVGKGLFSVLVVAGLVYGAGSPVSLTVLKAVCGAAAISGHDWSVFLGFRGGKGVATGAGVFVGVAPVYLLISLAAFVVAVIVGRHVSVGSLVLAGCVPVVLAIAGEPVWYSGLGVLWLVSVLYLHRENIRRLLRGTEGRVGRGVEVSSEDS